MNKVDIDENLDYVSDIYKDEELSKTAKEAADKMLTSYFQNIVEYEKPHIRNFNISRYKAYITAENYLK